MNKLFSVAVGGMIAALTISTDSTAQCVAAKPPLAPLSTVLKSSAFRLSAVSDPLLELRINADLASAARYSIEYFDPVDPTAVAPTQVEHVDPSIVQTLTEDKTGRNYIDLRGVGLLEGYRQARVVFDVPALDVKTPTLRSAAVVQTLTSVRNQLKRYVPVPRYGGQVVAIALTHSAGVTLGSGMSAEKAERLQDALVLITAEVGSGTMLCNGTLVGGGRVLTAGHCISNKMSVLMGQAWVQGDSAFGAELTCPGRASTTKLPAQDHQGLPMDIAVIDLPAGFGGAPSSARFERAALKVERRNAPPSSFRLAAIWTGERQKVGYTPDRAFYTPDYLAKQVFQPPSGGGKSTDSWCQAPSPAELKDCLTMGGGRSKSGWRHRCPSVKGLSGAPLFDGATDDLTVIAVDIGEGVRPDNCAATAAALPALD
jgi:hypothetical protein